MQSITRREMLKTTAMAAAGVAAAQVGWGAVSDEQRARKSGKIPLIHVTDLYHPPQDPDDQVDLATVAALEEFDVRGVVLDVTEKFLEPAPAGWDIARDPGFVPVVQLGQLTGRTFPVAMGPKAALPHPEDQALDRPRSEQAGVQLVLDIMDASVEPVVVSLVGSARVLTVAFNRQPELVRKKTKVVLLNAGATAGTKREWNVGLDPEAYVGLWRSGLPLRWYPCATERGAFDAAHERGTYWKAAHAALFKDLPAPLRGWFGYGFSGSARGDIIRALTDAGLGSVWETVLAGQRNLWSTASLVMAAGRTLAHTEHGWRFVPEGASAGLDHWPMRLDPISATVRNDGRVDWKISSGETGTSIFGRQPGLGYGLAMTEALNALLKSLPV